ncbi:membrane protein, putative [Erythrobacter sp. NAP1]|uniref:hypothetical protein n=1 Tax=Erythrobacter sp. NAP1 TaxID=237727 RepID=UPI0000686A64|nr:hypothetical protein [Erythrobacter sp. NAP1]EAQ30063.1 membrane protein, putative [Erythrobacter sp. NAP1]
MFIGHFAPAFIAAAAYSRGPKLGTYFVAAQLVDWAFFTLAIVGVEKMRVDPTATAMVPLDLYYYPFTHSLAGTGAWALGFALIVAIWHRSAVGGLLAGLVVASHWALDWLVHAPDLTIAGGDKAYGLGLWNFPEVAIPLEIGITLAAFFYYCSKSRGPVAQPILLILVMLAMQMVNWFGPHPEQAGLFFYLQALTAFAVITGFAVWVGENRYFMQRGGLAAAGL